MCLRLRLISPFLPYMNLMYYGNLSFDNYKEGHSKNPIINDIIQSVDQTQMFDGTPFTMSVAAKKDLSLENWIGAMNRVSLTAREDRARIWQNFSDSIENDNRLIIDPKTNEVTNIRIS